MADENDGDGGPYARSLLELFEADKKRFEWLAKQYYDLFAYHAAQRLTAFNFFLVSLSFFSTAYATLITKSDTSAGNFFPVAAALATAAYFLVIAFGRLDKRNEQIIGINERPLIRIQRTIRLGLATEGGDGDEVWETFVRADRSHPFRTFGDLLPLIYSLAATACAGGAVFGITGPGDTLNPCAVLGWLALAVLAVFLIYAPLPKARDGAAALEEASKVVRSVRNDPPAVLASAKTAEASAPTVRPRGAEPSRQSEKGLLGRIREWVASPFL